MVMEGEDEYDGFADFWYNYYPYGDSPITQPPTDLKPFDPSECVPVVF